MTYRRTDVYHGPRGHEVVIVRAEGSIILVTVDGQPASLIANRGEKS